MGNNAIFVEDITIMQPFAEQTMITPHRNVPREQGKRNPSRKHTRRRIVQIVVRQTVMMMVIYL